MKRERVRSVPCKAWVAFCAAGLASTALTARAEIGYGVSVGVGYTDNVARTAEGEQEETITSVGAALDWSQQTSRMDAAVVGEIHYLEYLDDTFDSEVVGTIVGNGSFDIVRERFAWTLEDTFGQTTIDQFSPVTAGNRENVNYLSTGPDFTLPLSSRVDFLLSGRYSDVYFEHSELDSERVSGEASLRRAISSASSAALKVLMEDVEAKDPASEGASTDFERREAFVEYELNGARTSLSVDLGYTELERTEAGVNQKADGPLARARLTRRVSPSSTVYLEGGQDFSDAGTIFRQLQSGEPTQFRTQPVQRVANPFTNTFGTLGWNFRRHRTGIDLRASYFEEEYEAASEFDRERLVGDLFLSRNLSSVTEATIRVSYSRQEYVEMSREFADLMSSLSFSWRLGRMSYLTAEYAYYDRSDDVPTDEYSENEFWLLFGIGGGTSQSMDMLSLTRTAR